MAVPTGPVRLAPRWTVPEWTVPEWTVPEWTVPGCQREARHVPGRPAARQMGEQWALGHGVWKGNRTAGLARGQLASRRAIPDPARSPARRAAHLRHSRRPCHFRHARGRRAGKRPGASASAVLSRTVIYPVPPCRVKSSSPARLSCLIRWSCRRSRGSCSGTSSCRERHPASAWPLPPPKRIPLPKGCQGQPGRRHSERCRARRERLARRPLGHGDRDGQALAARRRPSSAASGPGGCARPGR
jgi:hypothetical protein